MDEIAERKKFEEWASENNLCQSASSYYIPIGQGKQSKLQELWGEWKAQAAQIDELLI